MFPNRLFIDVYVFIVFFFHSERGLLLEFIVSGKSAICWSAVCGVMVNREWRASGLQNSPIHIPGAVGHTILFQVTHKQRLCFLPTMQSSEVLLLWRLSCFRLVWCSVADFNFLFFVTIHNSINFEYWKVAVFFILACLQHSGSMLSTHVTWMLFWWVCSRFKRSWDCQSLAIYL